MESAELPAAEQALPAEEVEAVEAAVPADAEPKMGEVRLRAG